MATTIVTKYGSDAPAASDIVRGELAVDTENGRLYTENAAGAVVEIGLKPEANVDVTGTITATGTSVFASLDISGDIDVDGTTNLDVVDIDGAVDFASTTAHAGNATFADNAKAIFGAGPEIEMYSDGTNGYIDTAQLIIANAAHTNNIAKFIQGGAVELFHNNAQKLATTSTGIQVTGNIANASGHLTLDVVGQLIVDTEDEGTVLLKNSGTQYGNFFNQGNDFLFKSLISDGDIVFKGVDSGAQITALTLDMSDGGRANFNNDIGLLDGKSVRFGTDNDSAIFHSGSAMTVANSTGNLTLDVAGDIILDADSGNITLQDGGTAIGQFQLNDSNHLKLVSKVSDADIFLQGVDGGSTITALRLDMSAAGAATFNSTVSVPTLTGVTTINTASSTGVLEIYGGATNKGGKILLSGGNNTSDGADIRFHTGASTANPSERARLTASGDLLVGTTDETSASGGVRIATDSSTNSGLLVYSHPTGTATGMWFDIFKYNTSVIGSITQSGTTGVLFNTSSDQRLKENIADADDAGRKVDAIQVRKFDWKADGSHQDYGMIAQELIEVAPEAVSAPADPSEMMGVDYSKLVPMLIKEIQQLRQRVAQLEE